MEPIARDAFTPAARQEILRAISIEEHELQDLGGFESFIFYRKATNSIVRMTHISHRDEEQVQAELEFVHHLAGNGAAVVSPLRFDDGSLVRVVDEFIISQLTCAPGRLITESDWQPGLFKAFGKCIGQFHYFAKQFTQPVFRRIDWQADANLDFQSRIPESQSRVLEQGDACLKQLSQLPENDDVYGLIHSDAHAGNFFVADGKLTFFDFDDCCYQWFGFDVATVLFSIVLQSWVENTRAVQETEAIKFLPVFLEGYDSVLPVASLQLGQLHLFLKARELSLYAVIHAHMDVNNLKGWYPVKFMLNRRLRIEAGEPYLDLDFVQRFA